MKLPHLSSVLLASLFTLFVASTARGQVSLDYLGVLGGQYSFATGINDSGEVVGDAATGNANPVPMTAFLYTPSTGMEAITGLNGTNSGAAGINDSGEIVGGVTVGSQDEAFTYTAAGGMQTVPTTTNGGYSSGEAINASGQVAGQYSPAGVVSGQQGFLYTPGSGLQAAGPVGQTNAAAINASGTVAGSYWASSEISHAFVYSSSGGFQDLGVPSGYITSSASGINNSGQVVGTVGTMGQAAQAFLFSQSTGIVALGTLGSGFTSAALGINNEGYVVGDSTTTGQGVLQGGPVDAFLYTATGGMQDLNTLFSSLLVSGTGSQAGFTDLIEATAINDEGQIVGEGDYYNGSTTYGAAFLLNTDMVPEPPAWLLLGLGGLILLVGVKMKRLRSVHAS